MTATPPLPLIHGHARSKATRASTASPAPAPLAAGVDGSSHPSSHVPKETRSDRAATLLIRRTLCAHRDQRPVGREGDDASPRPVLDLLPPLTSSTEVDLQLYALVAILVRDYILPWYSRVTSDREFIDEIVQVIAHCCRALERRSREVDLEALLVDEIPSLLNAHLDAYRASYPTVNAALPPDARQAFHALYPHPALSPVPDPGTSGTVEEQRRNEVAYRKLMAQRVLAVLLPAEDLENDCLRTLVEEICAETILGNVAEKGSEAWRWHHGIIALVHAFRTDTVGGLAGAPVKADGAAGKGHTTVKNQYDQVMGSVLGGFWTLLHLIWLGLAGLRFLIVAIVTSSALPTRSKPAPRATAPPTRDKGSAIGDGASMASDAPPVKRPLITMAIWSSASRLLDLDGHMPWLHGMGQLGQWGLLTGPGRVGEVDGMLDRYLSYQLRSKVLSPSYVPVLLSKIRDSVPAHTNTAAATTTATTTTTVATATTSPLSPLSPLSNTLALSLSPSPSASPSAPPLATAHQAAAAAQTERPTNLGPQCAEAVLGAIPAGIRATYFATPDLATQTHLLQSSMLAFLRDPYALKHLVYAVVDLCVVRLVPEMAARGGSVAPAAAVG